MQRSRYSRPSPSVSSAASTQRSAANARKSPVPAGYEYLGRLVTRERPVVQKSKSTHQTSNFSQTKHQQKYVVQSHAQDDYEDASYSSSGDDIDNTDGLSKPVGVIRINDRHLREIYRLPTPPPKVKRVYHRLRSPETRIIERVFVRRPPPQIIENIIEVPPEKVRIVNREKYLGKSKPITRSKLIHLKARDHEREAEQHEEEEEEEVRGREQPPEPAIIPTDQYLQPQPQVQPQQQPAAVCTTSGQCYLPQQQMQTTTFTHTASQPPTTTTAMVYPSQPNMRTVGYIQSSIPPHMMFNTQQPFQLPAPQTPQPTPYTFAPQQTVSHQTMKPATTYNYIPQPSTTPMLPFGHPRY